MKCHLPGRVLVGYAHRASASSQAAAAETVTAAVAADVADAGRDIVTAI